MKKIYYLITTLLLLGAMNIHAQVTVSASAGTLSGSYSTLKGAFDAVNNGTHQGVIDIRLDASTSETDSARLDSSGGIGGALYTSILIRPADTATVVKDINASFGGKAIVYFNGADNVVIDGRPAGTGTVSRLRINSTTTSANSQNLRMINGVQNVTINYLSSSCALSPTVTSIIHILSTAGTSSQAPNNVTISNCELRGGAQGIQIGGTAALPTTAFTIYRNTILNFRTLGIFLSGGIFSITVDSNTVWHESTYSSNETATVFGMDLNCNPNVSNASYTISRNTIGNFALSAPISTSGYQGIRVFPTVALTSNTVNVLNNAISMTRTNASVNGSQVIQGIRFSGNQNLTANFINNTIRIGGAATGGAANVINSIGMIKANTGASTVYTARNNVIINERTAAGGFACAYWMNNTTATNNVNFNAYYTPTGNYTALWWNGANLSIYQAASLYKTGALVPPNESRTEFGYVNFVSTSDLSLAPASNGDFGLLGGSPSILVPADIAGTVRNTTYPYKGAFEGTAFPLIDASVAEVYTLGKLPIPFANPHTIRAALRNTGVNDTIYNVKVYAEVSAPNSNLDSVIVDTIIKNVVKYVDFPGYNYANIGSGTVTVTIAIDSFAGNNSKSTAQNVTTGTYAYANPTLPAAGGVGFNGVGGDFVAKFPYVGTNSINQVGVNFNTGGQPYQIVIYNISGDTPSTVLWNSATLTSAAGINTISVNPPVPISGTFFVGVRQTGLTNVAFGYQNEDPIRDKTFYYKANTVASWADFASTNSAFRFMVEPRLQIADDIGAFGVKQPCNAVAINTPPIAPQIEVFNFGLNAQSNFIIKTQITGPVSYNNSDTITGASLLGGTSQVFTLPSTFNPNTLGTYTMKIWTELGVDLEANNDTITYVFDVVDINTATNAGNHMLMAGSQHLSINGTSSVSISGSQLTLQGWINYSGTGTRYVFSKQTDSISPPQYALYINPTNNLVFVINTTSGLDSVVSSSTIGSFFYKHVAAVYDGTTAKVYIDGELVGTKSITGLLIPNTANLQIGRLLNVGSSNFSGTMDEISVWDTARTESQIRTNMHVRMGNFFHPNLKAYLRMDAINGNYIADASGNCANALLVNAPTIAASTIPLGAPVVSNQIITTSGSVNFPAASIALNTFNQSGTNEVYIHRFAGLPIGTLPSTAPGTVTNTNINNWIVYRYGSGTMDSAEATFSISGISLAATPADLFLFGRGNGENGGWIAMDTANAVDPALQTVTMRLLSSEFNRQLTIGATGMVLPVSLLYFTGKNTRTDVTLNWATANELDNAGFYVERSTNGRNFTQVGFVQGKGTTNSNTRYAWVDQNAFVTAGARKLYYRLVQRDFSGAQTTTPIVTVLSEVAITNKATAYPNPFSNEVSIAVDSERDGILEVTILDVTGRIVYQASESVKAGLSNIETTGLQKLGNGMYIVRTKLNGITETQKLLKE